MEIKKFMVMAAAAVALVFGVCSCGDDDDEPNNPTQQTENKDKQGDSTQQNDSTQQADLSLAAQVAGAYVGEEKLTVAGSVFDSIQTYVFAKATDMTVDMTIPATEGSMALPALPVKGIALTSGGAVITGQLESYAGTVTDATGAEKAYTVSKVTAIFQKKTVVVTYTLKYGRMPFDFVGQFTGTKED